MKKIIALLCILSLIIIRAQTFSDIDKLSNFTGKTFDELESQFKIKNAGKKTILGLEHRSYEFKSFSALISEYDDSKTISEISILSPINKNYQEAWYQIVSKMNNNPEYKFIKSFVADPDDSITSNKLDYNGLISTLRKSYKSDEWIGEVVYNKGFNYYRISYTPVTISILIQNRPFEKKSYEDF